MAKHLQPKAINELTKKTIGLEEEPTPKAKTTKKAKRGRPSNDTKGLSVCIYLSEEVKDYVEQKALEDDRSVSSYITRLIKAEMNKGK